VNIHKLFMARQLPSTNILRVSHRIHDEAIIILYQINAIGIWIEHQFDDPNNYSIMRRPGYRMNITHNDSQHTRPGMYRTDLPRNMLKYMQTVYVHIGTLDGIDESDIAPTEFQTLSGPQRPAYRTLIDKVEEACELLMSCDKIHNLTINVQSNEIEPGSIEQVLEPIKRLRGIKGTRVDVFACEPSESEIWSLRPSYEGYLEKIIAMPEGTEAPKYVPDVGEYGKGIFSISEQGMDDDFNEWDPYLLDDEMAGIEWMDDTGEYVEAPFAPHFCCEHCVHVSDGFEESMPWSMDADSPQGPRSCEPGDEDYSF
jgi:hypothetical protein